MFSFDELIMCAMMALFLLHATDFVGLRHRIHNLEERLEELEKGEDDNI